MKFVNGLRGPLGLLTAWLMVVTVGSAMVWTVISRAGDDLVPTSSPAFRASAAAAPEESAPPAGGVPQPTSKAMIIRPKRPDPPLPSTAASPPAEPVAPPTPSATKDPDDWDGDREETPPLVRATWQGTGGLVIVECRGWEIRLIGAPADSGYRVDVLASGPRRIRVQFTAQTQEPELTEVYSSCRYGRPRFYSRTGPGDGTWYDETVTQG
jgi:hypothetical protein